MSETGNRGRVLATLTAVILAGLALAGCDGKPGGTYAHSGGVVDGWPVWGHGHMGQRYGANTQITPQNVKDLKVAWAYRTGDLSEPGKRADLAFEATPILANNTLYLCSPRSRIIAPDPTTGKQKWMFDAHPDTNGATVITCRGVSYADTGKPCSGFGDHGKVDLHQGLGFIEKPGLWGISSAPAIVGDMVITGSKIIETASGKEVWRVSLPAAGQSMPMTYRLNSDGKQYVVLSAGGHSALQNKQGDYVIAYALS